MRSLIRQLEQIRRSATYNDVVSNVNSSAVAEPTISGSLEDDLNNLRTLVKDVKGSTNWYDTTGTYFDPKDTDSSSTANKDLNLDNISGNTLDSATIILAVTDNNTAAGYTVSGTSTGVLIDLSTAYATDADRRGLPIFASTAHNGSYHDEGGDDTVCRIDVVNNDTDASIYNNSGELIYARFHDGADFSGTGTGTDVYARFYANNVACDLSTVSGVDVTNISFVYPHRKVMADMEEYEWLRTDFISSWEGDIELIEDISNLWSYTGANNDDENPQPWNNVSASYIFSDAGASGPSSLKSALDYLNDGVGDRLYLEQNYITSGESIADSLDKLDQEIADLNAQSGDKYVEETSVLIHKNVPYTLPYSITYTPDGTAGREGSNLDIYVGGQLLAASTGVNGVNSDRDYNEASTTTVTFMFNIQAGRNITYVVRQ